MCDRVTYPYQTCHSHPDHIVHSSRQPSGETVEHGSIPAGATTEDDDIEFLRHETSSSNTLQLRSIGPPKPGPRLDVSNVSLESEIPAREPADRSPTLADLTLGESPWPLMNAPAMSFTCALKSISAPRPPQL